MRLGLVLGAVAIAVSLGFAACGGGSSPEKTATPAPSASPTADPNAEPPLPQPITFAPGEVVSADGPGIFFTDPYTGATEGWYLPDAVNKEEPFEFSVSDVTADGRLLLYECQRHNGEGLLAPCGATDPGAPHTWYLFNTETGDRRRLDAFTGPSLTLSPDGRTLFGLTDKGPALQAVEGGETRVVEVSDNPSLVPAGARWSPRGDTVVLGLLPKELVMAGVGYWEMSLLRVDAPGPVKLLEGSGKVDWAADGSRVALVVSQFRYDGETPGILVFDSTGRELWSSPLGGYPNPRWSPDGSRVAAQVDFEVKAGSEAGCSGEATACILSHLDVFDGATGEPLYRVAGAIACADQVWTADGSHLLVEGYASGGSVLVDPESRTFKPLGTYVVLTPFDAGLAISWDGDNLRAVDLDTGESRLLVATTVRPAWDWLHEPLFVGGRIKFTAWHGGHGGCAMGSAPKPPPELEILYPPYGE